MTSDRRVNLISCAQHAAKLAVTMSMDVARYVENESEVSRQSAEFYIRSIRTELGLLVDALNADPHDVEQAA